MARISAVLVSVVPVVAIFVACGGSSSNQPAPAASVNAGYPPPGYTAQPGYPPPTGYPTATATAPAYPPPGTPPQPGVAPAGTMSVPGPAALPCTSDASCMTHRCNTQYGKCAFPCQSDADCIQGATCFTGGGAMAACIPKPPGS